MASNRKSQANLSGWRDKLSSILSSPVHQGNSTSHQDQSGDTELKNIGDDSWCFIEDTDMESVSNGDGTSSTRKKSANKLSPSLGPSLGPRSSSVSGQKSTRSTISSPSSLQRSSSSRGRKPINLDVVQNGRSNGRSSSPGRSISGPGRSNSPNRSPLPKKSSMSSSRSTSSPVPSHAHQNGTKATADMDDSSLASKIRDTLRISRPKKKKGTKGKGLAYSVTPVEINMNASSKYQDPFETSCSEGTDSKASQDHSFKPVSIPHNKPEYCDVCGETAWGLYRQVLKCASESCIIVCNYLDVY